MRTTRGTFNTVFSISVFVVVSWLIGPQQASAQLNERRIKRDASGVYKGKITKGLRIRKIPGGSEVIPGDVAQGKLRVPIKDGRLKTTLRDDELEGSQKAILKGKERKSSVQRQGKKISFYAKGKMDIIGDNHNPYEKGKIRGPFVARGSKWLAKTKISARRLDNDGFTSCFQARASGKQ